MSTETSDPVIREYSEAAEDYDDRWAFYVDATTRQTLARLPIRPKDSVLDIGCGTGELLVRLAAKYPAARLAGLDPVPAMLDKARRKLSDKVELGVGWATRRKLRSGGLLQHVPLHHASR